MDRPSQEYVDQLMNEAFAVIDNKNYREIDICLSMLSSAATIAIFTGIDEDLFLQAAVGCTVNRKDDAITHRVTDSSPILVADVGSQLTKTMMKHGRPGACMVMSGAPLYANKCNMSHKTFIELAQKFYKHACTLKERVASVNTVKQNPLFYN